MLSIIITAYKEPETIAQAVKHLIDSDINGYSGDVELITVIPDEETKSAAAKEIEKYKINWISITDPKLGKPHALNLGLEAATGDILLLTDGDVYFGENAVANIVEAFNDESIGGATGRPISQNSKSNFMGYISHLLADAAHHKRMVTLKGIASGYSQVLFKDNLHFFVLSGYILAMRNYKIMVPEDTLVDDAYISYELFNRKLRLAYVPEALVYVKYPTTLKDWYKQKLRSVGGYVQLWKYGVIQQSTKVRNFWKELEYIWFPIKYARSFKELLWSFCLYPMRLFMWLIIFYQQKIRKRNLEEVWVRIESTK